MVTSPSHLPAFTSPKSINKVAADRAGLKISSKLLSLVKVVTDQD